MVIARTASSRPNDRLIDPPQGFAPWPPCTSQARRRRQVSRRVAREAWGCLSVLRTTWCRRAWDLSYAGVSRSRCTVWRSIQKPGGPRISGCPVSSAKAMRRKSVRRSGVIANSTGLKHRVGRDVPQFRVDDACEQVRVHGRGSAYLRRAVAEASVFRMSSLPAASVK